MQSVYDINTIIIVVTFLLVLLGISFFINKKKDLLRSRIGYSNTLNIVSSSVIGNGNKATIFEIQNKSYLVVTNRSHISNIILLPEENIENKNISGEKNE